MTSSRTNAATRSRSSMRSGESSKSMSGLEILEDRGGPLPAAHAHGHHAVSRSTTPHFAHELHGQLRSGRAERMAKRDRATIHVDALLVHSELAHHRQRLGAERFVQFDEIDLLELQASEPERLRDSGHRPHAHDLGRYSADGERYESH